jgi:hypothetical protein
MHEVVSRIARSFSRTLGTIEEKKATREGLTGVFATLAREHGEMKALLLLVGAANDPKVWREGFPRIRTELLAHERAEARAVYPVLRQHEALSAIAEAHEVDARNIEAQLDRLSATDCEHPDWKATYDALVDLFNRHAKQEEDEYFPEASRVLGPEGCERLPGVYEAAKALPGSS